MAVVCLSACAPNAPQVAPAPVFTVAQQREPASLNPALENGTSSTEWGELLFQYLVKYDDRGRLIGDLLAGPFSRYARAVLGDGIALIDPAFTQAERTAELLGGRAQGSGSTEYTTSGDEVAFLANVARFL